MEVHVLGTKIPISAHFTTPVGSQNPWSHNRSGTLVPLVQVLEKRVWSSTATGGR